MPAEQGLGAPSLLFLPEDLVVDIASQLDDWDVCCMELASKELCETMSRHCSWPRERQLNLTAFSGTLRLPLNPETARLTLSL